MKLRRFPDTRIGLQSSLGFHINSLFGLGLKASPSAAYRKEVKATCFPSGSNGYYAVVFKNRIGCGLQPILKHLSILGLVWAMLLTGTGGMQAQSLVRFKTALGDVDVELFDKDKPVTVGNFLNYVTNGFYTNMFMHRWAPGFVIQGGGFAVARRGTTNATFTTVRNLGNITNEFLVGRKFSNTYGTIAMAKLGGDPNSASSQWFFNLADNSGNLDAQNGGFTVFGRVIQGTNVLNRFNDPKPENGIFALDLSNVSSAFTDVPVISNRPTFEDLVFADIRVVSLASAPTLSSQPVSQQVIAGNPFEFKVEAAGSGTLSYQWAVNGQVIPGATNSTYRITESGTQHAGNYSVVVRNEIGVATSREAVLGLLFQLTSNIRGEGRIFRNPDQITYPQGTTVELTCIPSVGFRFVKWEGNADVLTPTVKILLDSHKTVTAITEALPREPFPLTAALNHQENALEILVKGVIGGVYEFERSPDLSNWIPWLRVTNSSTGLRLIDPREGSPPKLFYRGRLTGFAAP